ncbi:amidohydrolase [Nocardia colli]|uniref:amidohydrolase n=1 Tax=Nocardia colli TaxID=2545717 RepID=UPI0035D78593
MVRSDVADLLFVGGPVYFGRGRVGETAVAVRDGRIQVGVEQPAKEVIDLRGRMLLPGFQDSHVHAVSAGITLGQCELAAARTVDMCVQAVADYARQHPHLAWITGSGWSNDVFAQGLPAHNPLDDILPDRPAFLIDRHRRTALVNSRALELAGIDELSREQLGSLDCDPDDVRIGLLRGDAVGSVARLVPEPTEAEQIAGLVRAQRMLHSFGITAWQDALLGPERDLADPGEAYLAAAESGLLTARVSGALWWDPDRGVEQIGELHARRERLSHPLLQASAVRIAVGDTKAVATQPNGGNQCIDGSVESGELRNIVTLLDAQGFQLHFQLADDRGSREALAAVESARRAHGERGNRHHLARTEAVRPADIPRLAELGVAVTLCSPTTVADGQFPFAELRACGAILAIGSDWPVGEPDPWRGIQAQLGRNDPADPDAAGTLADLVDAYTVGSAHVNHADDSGRIATGHRADLVVLDRNPFERSAVELGQVGVDLTFVAGELVHASANV